MKKTLHSETAYPLGIIALALGVSMFFHSYMSPEAYEMFVKETAGRYDLDIKEDQDSLRLAVLCLGSGLVISILRLHAL